MLALGTVNSCKHHIFSIKQLYGCTKVDIDPDDASLVKAALQDVNTALHSEQFKQAVLNEDFDPPQLTRDCDGSGCHILLTKKQLYDLLVSTSPKEIKVTLYDYLLPLTAGNQGSEDDRALGTVFANRKVVNGNQGFLASLMLHELMHLLGFHHFDEAHTCSSVPYSMNRIYGKVATQLKLAAPGSLNPCPQPGPYR
jgi:hypothetical protein